MRKNSRLNPGLTALIEVAVMFLPAIPAFIWLWPRVEGTALMIANAFSNVYAFAGALVIGLRCWSLSELGWNRRGFWLSILCGLAIVTGRILVILAVDWGLPLPRFSALNLLWEFFFLFALVGVGQELLFRGLVYQAFENWRGTRWAILGSSICFGFWHFGGGPLIIGATAIYGLIFALVRWRAGSILGLILAHGLMDFTALLLLPNLNVTSLGRPQIPHPFWMLAGLALIAAVPLYLWLLYPIVEESLPRRRSGASHSPVQSSHGLLLRLQGGQNDRTRAGNREPR